MKCGIPTSLKLCRKEATNHSTSSWGTTEGKEKPSLWSTGQMQRGTTANCSILELRASSSKNKLRLKTQQKRLRELLRKRRTLLKLDMRRRQRLWRSLMNNTKSNRKQPKPQLRLSPQSWVSSPSQVSRISELCLSILPHISRLPF